MSSFSNSRLKTFATSSGHFFLSAASCNSFFSGLPSPLPSSSFMFFICCWRKYSLCCSSISSLVRVLILCFMSSSCSSRLRILSTPMALFFKLESFSSPIFSFMAKGMLVLIKLRRMIGLLMFWMANCASSGMSSLFFMISIAKDFKSSIIVLNSLSESAGIFSLAVSTYPFK